jgi:C-terminal processing protease CtpA/Prc
VRPVVLLLLGLLATGCGGATTGSIGALLGRDNDTHALTVHEAPKGLAAAEAGLLPGDEIVMIDGFYVRDLGPKELRALLRGDVGSKVELTIVRGGDVRRVVVTRTALRTPLRPAPREEPIRE